MTDNRIKSYDLNSSGNLGIFRVLFTLFYLWHLSLRHLENLAGIPLRIWNDNHFIFRLLPNFFSNQYLLSFLEPALILTLVLLGFGWKTRLNTLLVLLFGLCLEFCYLGFHPERSSVVMVFYIPLIMLIEGSWGKTHSIDGLQIKKTELSDRPGKKHWRYSLPSQFILGVLSILFFGAAISKMFFGGIWLSSPTLISNLILAKNIKSAMLGSPINYFSVFIATNPIMYLGLHFGILFFEGSFFLAFFSPRLRSLIVSMALIFHSINAIWLIVTFSPILIAYALFVDFEKIKHGLTGKQFLYEFRLSSIQWVLIATVTAFILASLWNSSINVRGAFNLMGIIDHRTIWYPILPLAIFWFLNSLIRVIKSTLSFYRSHVE